MQFFFKKSKKLNEILQRSEMNDEEFIQKMQLSDNLAIKTVSCVRRELGKSFRISPEKLFPDDTFREIISLPCPEWDMMYLYWLLKKA
jgi:predicted secreted protein